MLKHNDNLAKCLGCSQPLFDPDSKCICDGLCPDCETEPCGCDENVLTEEQVKKVFQTYFKGNISVYYNDYYERFQVDIRRTDYISKELSLVELSKLANELGIAEIKINMDGCYTYFTFSLNKEQP